MYRGRQVTLRDLGLPGEVYSTKHLLLARRPRMVRPTMQLPAWPSEQLSNVHFQSSNGICWLSINMGGLSKESYDELQLWLHSDFITRHVHVILIQESWRQSFVFDSPSWVWMQSGRKPLQHQGVIVLINHSLAKLQECRCDEIVNGRLLKVLIPAKAGHPLRRRPISILCIYQYARSSESPEVYTKRAGIWQALDKAVAGIPKRHLMLLGGDFNTPLWPVQEIVGPGVIQSKVAPADAQELVQIMCSHGLIALNTWQTTTSSETFTGGDVSAQIDFLICRRADASGRARESRPFPQVKLSSWKLGKRHLLIGTVMQDTHPETRYPKLQLPSRLDREHVTKVLCTQPEALQELQREVSDFLAEANPTIMSLDACISNSVKKHVKGSTVKAAKPWQMPEAKLSLTGMWVARRRLMAMATIVRMTGSGVFSYWRQWALFMRQRRLLRKECLQRRRQVWESRLEQAESAWSKGDSRSFFQVVKQMAPRQPPGRFQLRDQDGQLLGPDAELDAIHDYWKGVFDNRSIPAQVWIMPQDIVFSCEEVLGTMKKLAMHKASSPGSAPAVGWKLLAEILAEPMTRFINGIFATGPLDIEAGLTTAWLCFLPKPNKANRKAGDLRPIALQPVPSKIITSLLRDRLQPYVDACVEGMPQFGYTKNRGTQEAIAIVAQHCKLVRDQVASQRLGIQDKHRGTSRKSCLGGAQLALDFSRAFDSMPRSCMQRMLLWAKVPEPLIIALLAWHEQTVYCFGEAGSTKGERCIRVTQGVKQGCQIAPALWTMFTCFVYDLINQHLGEKWCQEHLVGFADDTHLR